MSLHPSARGRSVLRSPSAPGLTGSASAQQVGFAEAVEVRAFGPAAPPRAIHWSAVPKGGAAKRS
eukprot:11058210-Alexandrium_andersonii.AAC.1